MTVITRYICAQMARPLFATLGVALLILVVERMLRILDLVLGWRGGVGLAIKLVVLIVPHLIGLALPVALFLAICLTFGRMSRDSELDGLLAAGIGLHQLARPPFIAAGLVTVVIALTVGYLQPHARYAYNLALHTLVTSSAYALVQEGTFTTLGDTTIAVERIPARGRLEGVFIYEEHSDGISSVTTARRGAILPTGTPDETALRLEQGVRQMTEDPLLEGSARRPPVITARFGEFKAVVQGELPGSFPARGGHEREMTLGELWAPATPLPDGVEPSEVKAELHGRLVHIATTLVLPALAVPLALGRRRSVRSSGLVAGLLILVVYNQVLQLGEAAAEDDIVSVWLGLWTPFALLAVGATALFYRAAFRLPKRDWGDQTGLVLDRLYGRLRRLVPGGAKQL